MCIFCLFCTDVSLLPSPHSPFALDLAGVDRQVRFGGCKSECQVMNMPLCNLERIATILKSCIWPTRGSCPPRNTSRLVAASGPMEFTFDEKGFNKNLGFTNFTASDLAPGFVHIVAQPTNKSAWDLARLVTWYGFRPSAGFIPTDAPSSIRLPAFGLQTSLLGAQQTTRGVRTPSVKLSVSQPGIYFVGIYGAWNGR